MVMSLDVFDVTFHDEGLVKEYAGNFPLTQNIKDIHVRAIVFSLHVLHYCVSLLFYLQNARFLMFVY